MSTFTAQPPDFLRELLASDLALVALFFVFVLEGTMLPYAAPSKLLVPGALVLVGEQLLLPILVVVVFGATADQVGLFPVVKWDGHEYLLSRPRLRVSEDSLDRFDGQFDRWGPVVAPLSNAMLFTCGTITVPARLSGVLVKRSLALSAFGTVVPESALAALYVFGGQVLT